MGVMTEESTTFEGVIGPDALSGSEAKNLLESLLVNDFPELATDSKRVQGIIEKMRMQAPEAFNKVDGRYSKKKLTKMFLDYSAQVSRNARGRDALDAVLDRVNTKRF